MASIRAKCKKLFFDFRYRGIRCCEHTKLPDTKANRKLMQRVLDKIEAQILQGTFDYAHCFPGSHNASKFATVPPSAPVSPAPPVVSSATPLYKGFAETWFNENEPAWRRSHRATLRSTLNLHLVPAFGEQAVGDITKADCLAFRAQIAKRHGRMGNRENRTHTQAGNRQAGQKLST